MPNIRVGLIAKIAASKAVQGLGMEVRIRDAHPRGDRDPRKINSF